MFARVVSHPQGKDSVNIPLSGDGRLSKEKMCSQFSGAVGLKYQIDQCWSAVPVQNDHLIVPQGDPLLVVVANPAGKFVLSSFMSLFTFISITIFIYFPIPFLYFCGYIIQNQTLRIKQINSLHVLCQ